MERLELYGDIDEKGIFTLHNRQRFEEWCRQNKDKNLVVKFSRKSSKRSDNQNRYYFGVVIKEITIRLRELGYHHLTDEEVHQMMKMKFNYEEIIGANDTSLEIPKSTTDLNKVEFGEYIDRIRDWAGDFLDIYIPDPQKVNLLF